MILESQGDTISTYFCPDRRQFVLALLGLSLSADISPIGSTQHPLTSPPSPLSQSPLWTLERDLGDVVRAGLFDWRYNGDVELIMNALRKLRLHVVDGDIPGLNIVFSMLKEDWGMNLRPWVLRLVLRLATCSEEDIGRLEQELHKHAHQKGERTHKTEAPNKINQMLSQHPLQYVISNDVGLIIGVEGFESGDLREIVGKHVAHSFSPNRQNSPQHRVGFSGVVTAVHCILDNTTFSLKAEVA